MQQIPEYKIVVLGGGGVGVMLYDIWHIVITFFQQRNIQKSTLTIRLLTDNFLDEYDPTIEDSYQKTIELEKNKPILLDILDTAGQEEFKSMRDQWIREGDGFLLVYSIISRHTFEEIQQIREHILQNKDCEQAPIVIAGNKCDLVNDRQVSVEEAKEVADYWKVPFFETSAKSCTNNVKAFYEVVREIQRYEKLKNNGNEQREKKKKFKCAIL